MATDYALSPEHDKAIFENDYVLISGAIETAQSVKIRLLVMLREWVYDPSIGIDWEGVMYKVHIPNRIKKQIIAREVLLTPGVSKLTEFQFGIDPIEKAALVEFRGKTIYSGDLIKVRMEL